MQPGTNLQSPSTTPVLDSHPLPTEAAAPEAVLRSFIGETFLLGRNVSEVSNEDSLLENGIIDSTGVLELIGFIEETFNIELADEEVIPENLDSIARISEFVRRKQQRKIET